MLVWGRRVYYIALHTKQNTAKKNAISVHIVEISNTYLKDEFEVLEGAWDCQ